MQKSCIDIVNFKYKLDADIQNLIDAGKIKIRGERGSIYPYDFLSKILPYWTDSVYQDIECMEVNPFEVIGGTYKDYSSVKTTKEHCQLINANSENSYDVPSYHKVGTFPLFVAWEGKNRVKAFREHNIPISCTVRLTKYPKPDELKIHKVKWKRGVYFVSCENLNLLNMKNNIIQVSYPQYVIPLLTRYGVKMGRTFCKPLSKNIDKRVFELLIKRTMSS